jgi:hypothetical protein
MTDVQRDYAEADRLIKSMRAAADTDRFLSAMTYFLTVGRKLQDR